MTPIPDYGDHMTLDEFCSSVHQGCFIPYDGSGHWATEKQMDSKSDVWEHYNHEVLTVRPPKWATHVMWFSK